MIEQRRTILEVKKLYDTMGSRPALVTCDDFDDWVCKYDRFPRSLFNEYIAARFLEDWGIPCPDISFIQVDPAHIPAELSNVMQPAFVRKLCFGSKVLPYAKEMDSFFEVFRGNNYELNKFQNKNDFLRIALFDLWCSNDDRNLGNYNLLFNPESNGYRFYPIDHVALFNGGNLDRPLYELSQEDSILCSPAAEVLFKAGSRLNDLVDQIVSDFYLYATQCGTRLDEYLADLPDSWEIDTVLVKSELAQLFDRQWLVKVEQVFRQYVQLGIR